MQRRRFVSLVPSALLASCAHEARRTTGVRVALVTDLGGLGDHSYNDSAYAGLIAARDRLGVSVALLQSRSAADYQPNLTLFASKSYDQVISVGYDQAPDLLEVAGRFPQRRFAIIDAVVAAPNITSVTFRSAEGSFLAGALAALVSTKRSIGFLGGVDIAIIREFEVGFTAGAQTIDRAIRVGVKYIGDFNDLAGGKELAALLYDQGADIVYTAAGKAGLGALGEARERSGVYAIGVDADQDALVPGKVLTSVLKRIDTSVFALAQLAAEHKPRPARLAFGVKEGGVGLTEFRYTRHIVTAAIIARLNALRASIAAGRIVVPVTRAELRRYLA